MFFTRRERRHQLHTIYGECNYVEAFQDAKKKNMPLKVAGTFPNSSRRILYVIFGHLKGAQNSSFSLLQNIEKALQ
jgi:hypothetical protein